MTQQINSTIELSDLALAATLSLHQPIIDIDITNPRRAIFVFNSTPKINSLIKSYWRKEIEVEPQAYFDELRKIKARLYEKTRR